jgi:hypothetical protein
MKTRIPRALWSLAAAAAVTAVALCTGGCAAGYDEVYGGGVYNYGWGGPYGYGYGGYYGGYHGGYYGGGGYYPGRPNYGGGAHVEHHGNWGPGNSNVRPTQHGGGRMGGGGGRMGGGGRR